MAVQDPSFPLTRETNSQQVIWENLANGDTGKPVRLNKFQDKSVQFFGTFGTGGTISFQGSNDPRANPDDADHASAEWDILTDAQANAITKTAAETEQVAENVLWIRPTVTAGDGSTDLTCSVLAVKTT